MTFWSGETIKEHAERPDSKFIVPFSKSQIDCASYKLSLGKEIYITAQQEPPYSDRKILDINESFFIPPGQFAFLLSEECLEIPTNVLGFISVATARKYAGLVNVSGFHVDPGFQGHLVFSVYNAGPKEIRLQRNEPLFLIWFSNLDNQDTRENRIVYGKHPQTGIPSDLIQNIRGNPVTLQHLANSIGKIENVELQSIKRDIFTMQRVAAGLAIGITVFIGAMTLIVDWNSTLHEQTNSSSSTSATISSPGQSSSPQISGNPIPYQTIQFPL